jgi:hypothetical protein
MLDDIRDEDLLAVDAGPVERFVEDTPGRPDEDVTLEILAIARLFAGQEELRPARPLAEDGLRRSLPQLAGATTGCSEADGGKACAGGHESGGMDRFWSWHGHRLRMGA